MVERKRCSPLKKKPTQGRAPDLKRRLLPSDFRKYLALNNTQKNLVESPGKKGFFQRPKQTVGEQDFHVKDFLAFYFDSKEDYLAVKQYFEIPSHATAHPILDEKKLAQMVRERLKEE